MDVFVRISISSPDNSEENYLSAELKVANRSLEIISSKDSVTDMHPERFHEEFVRVLNEATLYSNKLLIPLVIDGDSILEVVADDVAVEKEIKILLKETLKNE